jgi:hypothetical protein
MAKKSRKTAPPGRRAASKSGAKKSAATRSGTAKRATAARRRTPKKNPLSSEPLRRAFDAYEKVLRKHLPKEPELQGIIDQLLRAKDEAPLCRAADTGDHVPPRRPPR